MITDQIGLHSALSPLLIDKRAKKYVVDFFIANEKQGIYSNGSNSIRVSVTKPVKACLSTSKRRKCYKTDQNKLLVTI